MVKIFVGRLPESITKESLRDMFSKYGEVIDSEVLKNFGFVHMANKEEAEDAISNLDKTEIDGAKINVELSVTKVASAAKLFVGNLSEGTQSHEVHKLFKEFGTVIECDVIKNYAFVHMGREAQARDAIKNLNNTELNGNKIRVQMARTGGRSMSGGRGDFHGAMGRGSMSQWGSPRYNPYSYDDGYDLPLPRRSRGFASRHPGGSLAPYERSGLSDYSMGGRRGRPASSYMRLLRERALLSRLSGSDYDPYSGRSRGVGSGSSRLARGLDDAAAYTDFAIDDFADIPLGDGFGLNGSGGIDRYGGPSGYGSSFY